MNLAAVWKLPVIFSCENNLYGMGVPSAYTLAVHPQVYKLADAYGMRNHRVDGDDVVEVHEFMLQVAADVRSDGEPAFIEARTYQIQGHSVADRPTTALLKRSSTGFQGPHSRLPDQVDGRTPSIGRRVRRDRRRS